MYSCLWFYFQFAISFVFGPLNLHRVFRRRGLNIVLVMVVRIWDMKASDRLFASTYRTCTCLMILFGVLIRRYSNLCSWSECFTTICLKKWMSDCGKKLSVRETKFSNKNLKDSSHLLLFRSSFLRTADLKNIVSLARINQKRYSSHFIFATRNSVADEYLNTKYQNDFSVRAA